MVIAETLFWICSGLLLYIYAGYPAACRLLAAILRRQPRIGDAQPSVTIVVPAFNEASCIEQTVRNKLALDYPVSQLKIVVVSDGSDDGTDRIVSELRDERVRLLRQDPRAGKSAALNLGLQSASGEIIVFCDANSLYAPDALRALVAPFADPAVGYVTGRMVYRAADGSLTGQGCSAYMKFENRLRLWETQLGSIVGTDGGIDAIRRKLYQPLRVDQLPDFALPLSVVAKRYRVVYAAGALLFEDSLDATEDEFRMRNRVCLRAWHVLKEKAFLLNPLRYGLFSWQLLSHKWLRYLAGFFQLGAVLTNVALAGASEFWRALLIMQGLFYLAALAGHLARRSGKVPRPVTWSTYLCLVNAAAMVAFARFLRGERQILWTPRK